MDQEINTEKIISHTILFPEALSRYFKKRAKQNMRSLSSEVVVVLKGWVEERGRLNQTHDPEF